MATVSGGRAMIPRTRTPLSTMMLRLEVSVPIAFGGALPKLSGHDVNKRVKEGLVDGLALFCGALTHSHF
jgi:hypothetical protein